MGDKMYRLQRDYDYPSGTIRKGVVKSIKEWAEIFPDLVNCDISVKTDWFQPIETVVEAVSGSKIEDDKYWLFNCSDGMTYQTTPERLFQLISKDDKSGWQQKPNTGFPNPTSEKKRIEITNVGRHAFCTTIPVYQFTASEKIGADKYPAIKECLERILNSDDWSKYKGMDVRSPMIIREASPYKWAEEKPKVAAIERGDKIELYFNHNDTVYRMNLVKESWIEFIEKYPNFRNEREILQMEENAFNAGRELIRDSLFKFHSFSNYKSHNQQSK